MHRFQEYLKTDEVALQIIVPSIKDGLRCEFCFLLLALHAEQDLWRLEQAHRTSCPGLQRQFGGIGARRCCWESKDPGMWGEIAEL